MCKSQATQTNTYTQILEITPATKMNGKVILVIMILVAIGQMEEGEGCSARSDYDECRFSDVKEIKEHLKAIMNKLGIVNGTFQDPYLDDTEGS